MPRVPKREELLQCLNHRLSSQGPFHDTLVNCLRYNYEESFSSTHATVCRRVGSQQEPGNRLQQFCLQKGFCV